MTREVDLRTAALYRAGAREEPPPHVDSLVLEAAHTAARPFPAGAAAPRRSRWNAWSGSFALAASVVLTVSLVALVREAPESPHRVEQEAPPPVAVRPAPVVPPPALPASSGAGTADPARRTEAERPGPGPQAQADGRPLSAGHDREATALRESGTAAGTELARPAAPTPLPADEHAAAPAPAVPVAEKVEAAPALPPGRFAEPATRDDPATAARGGPPAADTSSRSDSASRSLAGATAAAGSVPGPRTHGRADTDAGATVSRERPSGFESARTVERRAGDWDEAAPTPGSAVAAADDRGTGAARAEPGAAKSPPSAAAAAPSRASAAPAVAAQAPATEPDLVMTRRESPERWLARILELRHAGQASLAAKELRAFRERHPDFPLPAELR